MPAYEEEVSEAIQEGVKISCLTQPIEILKDKKGNVKAVSCLRMGLGSFDSSGRRRPMAQSQDPLTIKADQVIMAIGQRLDISQLTGDVALMLNDKKFISVDPMNGATNIPGVFAGGDCTDGPSSVVQAIGAGERAAVGIDEYLSGENHAFWRYEKVTQTSYDPDDEVSSEKRATVRQIPVERRRHNFEEVELPWTEAIAIGQAHRCLRCDYGKHINEEVNVSTTTSKREASHV